MITKTRFFSCFKTLAIAFSVLFSLPAMSHDPGVMLYGKGTPLIDGFINDGEWDPAGTLQFAVNIPGGGIVPANLYVMNDEFNLYIAIEIMTVAPRSSAFFTFDNNHSGDNPSRDTYGVEGHARRSSDDIIGINPEIGFIDSVRTNKKCPHPDSWGGCGSFDTAVGGTIDGNGAFFSDNEMMVYEFSHPLKSQDAANDFQLRIGKVVGFNLFIRLIDPEASTPTLADTLFPSSNNIETFRFGDISIVDD